MADDRRRPGRHRPAAADLPPGELRARIDRAAAELATTMAADVKRPVEIPTAAPELAR